MHPRQTPNFQQLSYLHPPSARIPGMPPNPAQLAFAKVQNELSEGDLALKKMLLGNLDKFTLSLQINFDLTWYFIKTNAK